MISRRTNTGGSQHYPKNRTATLHFRAVLCFLWNYAFIFHSMPPCFIYRVLFTMVGRIWIIICKQYKNIDLFSETEIVTFQHNFRFAIHLRQRSGSLRIPLRKKSFGCQCSHSWASCVTSSLLRNLFRPDAPSGGRRGDSLRKQGPDYMEDVVERSISVSGWCPLCEQPRVDGRYPGKMTLTFASFFACSWCLSLLGLREVTSNIRVYCATLCEEIHV